MDFTPYRRDRIEYFNSEEIKHVLRRCVPEVDLIEFKQAKLRVEPDKIL